jgi:hypothetical protein
VRVERNQHWSRPRSSLAIVTSDRFWSSSHLVLWSSIWVSCGCRGSIFFLTHEGLEFMAFLFISSLSSIIFNPSCVEDLQTHSIWVLMNWNAQWLIWLFSLFVVTCLLNFLARDDFWALIGFSGILWEVLSLNPSRFSELFSWHSLFLVSLISVFLMLFFVLLLTCNYFGWYILIWICTDSSLICFLVWILYGWYSIYFSDMNGIGSTFVSLGSLKGSWVAVFTAIDCLYDTCYVFWSPVIKPALVLCWFLV